MNTTEPSELVLLIVKISFLALLWAFVLVVVRAVRLDLFGPSKRQQRRTPARPAGRAADRGNPARPAPRPAPQPARHHATPGALPTKIRVTKGPKAGTEIVLDGTPVTIGRAHEAKLVLDEDVASAWHAKLFFRDGQWFIEDVGSTNGTYLDRTKVTSPMPVSLGAPIRIGKTVLELHP